MDEEAIRTHRHINQHRWRSIGGFDVEFAAGRTKVVTAFIFHNLFFDKTDRFNVVSIVGLVNKISDRVGRADAKPQMRRKRS